MILDMEGLDYAIELGQPTIDLLTGDDGNYQAKCESLQIELVEVKEGMKKVMSFLLWMAERHAHESSPNRCECKDCMELRQTLLKLY